MLTVSTPRVHISCVHLRFYSFFLRIETKVFVKFLLKDSIAQTRDEDCTYTLDNFAYGTTPYQSYLALSKCAYVKEAMNSCRGANSSKHFAIFGSSIGLVSFFASLSDNVKTVNYELLPFLHTKAEKIRRWVGAMIVDPKSLCETNLP